MKPIRPCGSMINIYRQGPKGLEELEEPTSDCWINMFSPTHNELHEISDVCDLPMELLTAALDTEERSRYEVEEGALLIIIRAPIINDDPESEIPYLTRPIGLIWRDDMMVTVCTRETSVLEDFIDNKVRDFTLDDKLRFIIQIFYRTVLRFLRALKDINLQTNDIEHELQHSLKNKELMRLLNYEKSLVYFTTSLRSNQILMERLKKARSFRNADPDDIELLDDILIDNYQAIEMANIYTNILSGLMNAFASVISNSLNSVMHTLTKITVVLMLPTLVASFYGMNVKSLPLQENPYSFIIILSICVLLSLITVVALSTRKWF